MRSGPPVQYMKLHGDYLDEIAHVEAGRRKLAQLRDMLGEKLYRAARDSLDKTEKSALAALNSLRHGAGDPPLTMGAAHVRAAARRRAA